MTNFTAEEAKSFDAYVAGCGCVPVVKPITLHEALRTVAADDPDRARTRNDVGFSGFDTNFACDIAKRDRLSAKVEWYVARFVRKYRRQVVANYEAQGVQITQGIKGKAAVAAVDAWLATFVWEYQSAEEVAAASKPKNVISCASGAVSGTVQHFVVRFPYNYNTVESFKAAVDWRDRKFDKTNAKDPKWVVVPTPAAVDALRAFAKANSFFVTPGAEAAFEQLSPARKAA